MIGFLPVSSLFSRINISERHLKKNAGRRYRAVNPSDGGGNVLSKGVWVGKITIKDRFTYYNTCATSIII